MATNSLEPGTRIGGRYQLMRRLAVGGMGEVWVARNLSTGADVAVKLCAGNQVSPETRERFRQEARLGAMLSHRSIVRTFDLLEEADGRLVLVMELLRGESLERHLQGRGSLPVNEAMAIAIPVLSALSHAHERNVIHRDVSPANIFLSIDPDGQVTPKLLDFGIAKLPSLAVKTMEGRVLGTPRYMSPEQIRTQPALDGRSDLFSVAAIVYEMLTGASPFAASTPSASLAAVLEAVVDPDARIDPPVWIEVNRALSKRPYERQRNARELSDALLAACRETEASLVTLLRREPPANVDCTVEAVVPPETQNVGGRSLVSTAVAAIAPRKTRKRFVVVGALVGAGFVAMGLALRNSTTGAAAPATPTTLYVVRRGTRRECWNRGEAAAFPSD